jgi:hypothetical protein
MHEPKAKRWRTWFICTQTLLSGIPFESATVICTLLLRIRSILALASLTQSPFTAEAGKKKYNTRIAAIDDLILLLKE